MTPTWHGTWHINSTRVFRNPRKQRSTNPFAHLIHHNSIGSARISQDQSIRKPFIMAANGRLNHFSLHWLVQGPVWFNAIKGQCGVKMSFGVQNFNIMQYCYAAIPCVYTHSVKTPTENHADLLNYKFLWCQCIECKHIIALSVLYHLIKSYPTMVIACRSVAPNLSSKFPR